MNESPNNSIPKSASANPTEDRIGRLVQLAGQRPAVPDRRSARVKAAVHGYWREECGRRARRRRIWLAVGLATAGGLVVSLGVLNRSNQLPEDFENQVAVEAVIQPVWVSHPDSGRPASPEVVGVGTRIPFGAELATEAQGRLAVRLPSGVSLRLDVDTRIRIASGSTLYLDRGAVYIDTGRKAGTGRSEVTVRTASGMVRDFGTQFEVRRQGDSLRIRVREGRVILERDRDSYEVQFGNELKVDGNGNPTRRKSPIWGPDWLWVSQVTPPENLDGLPLETFLGWLARERGWQLRFADDRIAASASEIILSGSMQGLSLEQALEVVLVSSRMNSRVERGVLFIDADDADPRAIGGE